MRHRRNFNHLSRTSTHRKAMLSNMATSLILKKRINTTLAKAKALRMYIEPIITRSKEDTTHSRRIVFSYLQSKEAVTELFRDISQKVADRPGGYTRILKTGSRLGDSAQMAMIELVDYNEYMLGTKTDEKKEKAGVRRRRGLGKKKAVTATAPAGSAKPSSKAKAAKAEKEPEPAAPETEAGDDQEIMDEHSEEK